MCLLYKCDLKITDWCYFKGDYHLVSRERYCDVTENVQCLFLGISVILGLFILGISIKKLDETCQYDFWYTRPYILQLLTGWFTEAGYSALHFTLSCYKEERRETGKLCEEQRAYIILMFLNGALKSTSCQGKYICQ